MMFKTLKAFFTNVHALITVGATLFVLFWVYYAFTPPKPVVVQTTPTVKTVYVEKPVVTTKTVTQVIHDPQDQKAIAALMAQVTQLKAQPVAVTDSTAVAVSSGLGPIVIATPPNAPATVTFKDWRLTFNATGTQATYDLHQQFKVFTTTGRQQDGKSLSLVTVQEVGADGALLPPMAVETVAIFSDLTLPHWMVTPTIQAGVNISSNDQGGVIGVQWLKRGRTKAAEDSTWAIATPVVFVARGIHELGVLPVSYNIGSIPHSPFKDLWTSPYVGWNAQQATVSRIGFTFTASF